MQIMTVTSDNTFGHLLSKEEKTKLLPALKSAKKSFEGFCDSEIVIYETPEDFLE